MKMLAEYLEKAVEFEAMAAREKDPKLKADLEKQAAAYRSSLFPEQNNTILIYRRNRSEIAPFPAALVCRRNGRVFYRARP